MNEKLFERAVEAAAEAMCADEVDTGYSSALWNDPYCDRDWYLRNARTAVVVALAEVERPIKAQALRDAADREDAAAPKYGYRNNTDWARREAEWIERAAGLRPMPEGWCGDKEPHDPHPYASDTFGPFACVGTEEENEN